MSGLDIVGIIAIVVLLAVAAVLAAAETALTNLTNLTSARARASTNGDDSDSVNGDELGWFLDNRERVLSPIFLVNISAHLGAAAILVLLMEGVTWYWLVVALAGLGAVFFTCAEALPKGWALHDPAGVARQLTPVVRGLHAIPPLRWVASALVWFSNKALPAGRPGHAGISDDELMAVASAAVAAELLEASKGELIASAIEFGATVVREVMTPRTDMVAVARDTTVAEALSQTIESGFSRLPVYRDRADDIVGVVHAKRLAQADRAGKGTDLALSVARNPLYVPETKTVESLLRQMQEERNLMAIVVDEYGGTAGVVTMEDLVEELVGEIVDEFDREEPLFERDAAGHVVVHGRMPVDQLATLMETPLPDGVWDTVGGMIFSELGHLPAAGEHLELPGLMLVVEQVEGRRITQVRVSVDTPEPSPDFESIDPVSLDPVAFDAIPVDAASPDVDHFDVDANTGRESWEQTSER